MIANKQAVVVTTEHRGVFFGEGDPSAMADRTIRLENVQMCIYWSADVRGVMGLAAIGPTKGCKVGPVVPGMTITQVTGVMEATDEAAVAWKAAPWAR